jgi:hypothetical protein
MFSKTDVGPTENRKISLLLLELDHDSSPVQPVSNHCTYSFPGHYSWIILAFHAIGLSLETPRASSNKSRTAVARVQTRVWSCRILWWTKVALGQVYSENFSFPCQSTFHLLPHNHLHCHQRLAQ